MEKPVCLITGATEGVGKFTALELAKSAFEGLACHLSLCRLLKLRLFVDSIPSALTIPFQLLAEPKL